MSNIISQMVDTHDFTEELVARFVDWADRRESAFVAEVPSYDPVPGEQPASDEDMDDWDLIDDEYAQQAVELLRELATKARLILS